MQNEIRLQSNGIRRLIKYVIISMINRVGKNQRWPLSKPHIIYLNITIKGDALYGA